MTPGLGVPPPVAPRPRPGTVTLACVALVAVLLSSIAYLGARTGVAGAVRTALESEFAGTEGEEFIGVIVAFLFVDAVIYVLVGAVLAVLAIFVMAGRNGVRITTWVIGGLGLCCGVVSLASFAGNAAMDVWVNDPNAPETAEIDRIITEETPAWYEPLTIASVIVGLVALLVAMILLMLPPSNEYFRKHPPQPVAPPPYQPGPYPPPVYGQQPYPPPPPHPGARYGAGAAGAGAAGAGAAGAGAAFDPWPSEGGHAGGDSGEGRGGGDGGGGGGD